MAAVLVSLIAVAAVAVSLDDALTHPLFRALVVTQVVLGGAGSALTGVIASFLPLVVAAWTRSSRDCC